jgi:hypothetical protein
MARQVTAARRMFRVISLTITAPGRSWPAGQAKTRIK